MNILVLNNLILAVDPVDDGDFWDAGDLIIPKHNHQDAVLVDVELPEGFSIATHEYVGGAVIKKPDSPEAILAARATRKAECDRLAKSKRDSIVADVSPAEMASWPIKRAESLAYGAKGEAATDADAPTVAKEAAKRGVSTVVLVAKVLDKAEKLSDLEALIAGNNGRINDAINAADTVEAVNEVDINSGWPV